jgi:molybdopterin converting factor small subunit
MNTLIHIPTPLRAYTDNNASVLVEGTDTVGAALGQLTERHPALSKHLRKPDGALRSFVNVYMGEEDIRFLNKEDTALTGEDLTIVPSIAGGVA